MDRLSCRAGLAYRWVWSGLLLANLSFLIFVSKFLKKKIFVFKRLNKRHDWRLFIKHSRSLLPQARHGEGSHHIHDAAAAGVRTLILSMIWDDHDCQTQLICCRRRFNVAPLLSPIRVRHALTASCQLARRAGRLNNYKCCLGTETSWTYSVYDQIEHNFLFSRTCLVTYFIKRGLKFYSQTNIKFKTEPYLNRVRPCLRQLISDELL
jgi:hypothetical protein